MKFNVGGIDRALRIVVGIALIAMVFVGPKAFAESTIPWVWGWVGIVPLATGLIGWCPPYAMFGWSTAKKS